MSSDIIGRLLLFSSSYSPLFLILGLRSSSTNQTAAIVLYGLAALSIAFLSSFLLVAMRFKPHIATINDATLHDEEIMSYVVTYLLPFIGISFSDLANAISLCIILAIIAILYIRSNMIYINPILAFLGYHLFEVHADSGKTRALISRHDYITTPTKIYVISLSDYAMLEKKV